MPIGPCAKIRVPARLFTPDGRTFDGVNDCEAPQAACPRIAAGDGRDNYAKCQHVCRQPGHAEIMALARAGKAAEGGVMLIGHWRACDACQGAMRAAGVLRWECVAPGDPRLGEWRS